MTMQIDDEELFAVSVQHWGSKSTLVVRGLTWTPTGCPGGGAQTTPRRSLYIATNI